MAAFADFADFCGLEDMSSDRKAWSLFLVDSETGASDCRGPMLVVLLLAAGLLLVLCHPPRCGCHVSKGFQVSLDKCSFATDLGGLGIGV